MTEEQTKLLAKQIIENWSRYLSDDEKELLKQAVDKANYLYQVIGAVALARNICIKNVRNGWINGVVC